MKQLIKRYGFLFFFSLNFLAVSAQQKHFLYVQSEDNQPFAIVMNGKVFSSSDYGYIIIPKLDDGDYKFIVSFPMNKFPDQTFTCSVNKKDIGYYLKNSNDSWALENMQTQKLLVSGAAGTANNSAFGDMLSDVVSDSNLTKNAAPSPTETAVGNVAVESAPVVADAAIVAGATTQKIAESKVDDGTNMMFVDKSENNTDTITVFIPSENSKPAEETLAQNTTADDITQDSLSAASIQSTGTVAATENSKSPEEKKSKKRKKAEDEAEKSATDITNPFYNPEGTKAAEAATVAGTTAAVASGNNTSSVNNERSDCDNVISDDELNKVKRKMFSQDNDDDMVKYAVKSVSKKCISTDQVKILGSLFSSDDGRYNLYDALYKHVYDYSNYPTLENQILDPYYKKRFAALLR